MPERVSRLLNAVILGVIADPGWDMVCDESRATLNFGKTSQSGGVLLEDRTSSDTILHDWKT